MDRQAEDALLEAQLAALRSDERIVEQGRHAATLSPAERLREAYALCRRAIELIERLPDEVRARTLALVDDPPPGSEPILRRLAALASPDDPAGVEEPDEPIA